MSWPQWPAPTQPSVPSVLNPATPVINSAPAVVPPSLQYTPEQWAQVQQQNWNQWAQWQQQYQQWHQQYGAEYQKSINALAQAAQAQQAVASLPNVAVPPPLPVETTKPPPPTEEPPPSVPTYNSQQPPPPPQQGYNTAPPRQAEQRPPVHYQRNNQNPNWPAQNYPNKRPYEQAPEPEAKRPMVNKPGWQNQPPPPIKPRENVEELSEAEKKFDKQFAEWEAQFNKWKEQNAEHPDKEQYREYEKKWESWRAQLLERREQMKRKRLGLTVESPNRSKPQVAQQTFTQPPPKVVQNPTPRIAGPTPTPPVPFAKPPPTMNDEPLRFKETKTFPEIEDAVGDFIKPNTGGGIPGLDLVKDDPKPTKENDDIVVIDPEEKEKKGPDFDAISKGINTILGDQKLLTMLSMVSQTQNPKHSDNLTNTVSRIKEPIPLESTSQHLPYPDQSNQSFEDQSNHSEPHPPREFVNNFDDQTRSSFTMAHNEEMRFEGPGPINRNHFSNFKGNRFEEFRGERFIAPEERFGGPGPERFDRFGTNKDRFDRFDKFGANQERFDRFGTNQDKFGPNQDRFGPNQDKFGPNQDRFGPNPDKFGSNQDRFGPIQDKFGLNQERFGPNQDKFGPSQDRFGPNQDKFGPNQDKFGPSQDRFGPSLDKFGPNQDKFVSNRDKFGPSPDKFGPNQDRFGPTQQKFGSGQDRFDRFGSNQDRFERFGPNSNKFALDSNQDRFGPPRDDFMQEGSNERFSRNDRKFEPRLLSKGQFSDYNQEPFDNRQGHQFEENYDDYDYDAVAASFENDDPNAQQKRSEAQQWKREQSFQRKFKEAPIEPEPPSVVEPPKPEKLFEPATVIDYDHKSSKQVEPEVLLEPIFMFDYRHKPISRIPLPQRPKWLSDAVKNIREFDPPVVRPYEPPNLRRYPPPGDNWRNDRYQENWPPHRRNYDDRPMFEDRPRGRNDRNIPKRDERNFRPDDRKQPIQSMDFEEEKISDTEWPEDDELELQNKPEIAKFPKQEPEIKGSLIKNVVLIEDLISPPGRYKRPPRIVIILRGPPGSGKTFLAKLIKDKEVENGGSAPRILSLDDYFMIEQEKEVTEEGKKVKVKEMVYEYEPEMEESYRTSLIKSFKKTITDGYFSFIIVDNVNDKVKYFGEMWSFAKQNGFQVYICQLDLDVQTCSKRNIHGRSESDIEKCVANWEPTPSHHPILDATSLLQSASIPEVEMEEVNSPESDILEQDGSEDQVARSKWDNFDCSVDNLAKLDGLSKPLRHRTMEEYLRLDTEWTPIKPTKPGQKRVRWADLEEQKQQEKMRAIGFVVGHTNWDRMMDPTGGSSALTQTKYIERTGRYKVDPK